MPFEIIENLEDWGRKQSVPYVEFSIDGMGGLEFCDIAPQEEWDVEPEPEESFDADYVIRRQGELLDIHPSTFVEFAIQMPNKEMQTYEPFSFEGRRYLRQIYDTPSKRTLLKCGRQVEKSTLLGNKLISYSCIIQALNCLYVSPTNQQTKVFSQDRLKEPIETSNYLKSWTTTKLSDNVFLKKFINRSQITLRYCYMSADRVRGIPADVICIDELQDILTDNIPIIEECASHSNFKIFIYSGTPKSLDNPIEYYWTEYSTQNEWAVPCHRHSIQSGDGRVSSVYWNILDEGNIGKTSLVCDRCHKPINPDDSMSQWVALNPDIYKRIPKPYEGFRIPQIMVPWLSWEEILQKQQTYSRGKFHNEVLGLSYDSGTRPLTRRDVIDNCDPNIHLDREFQEKFRLYIGGSVPVYAGIDWGTGENTYTVLSLGAYIQERFTIFFVKRFEGRESEPDVMMAEIYSIIEKWGARRIGCDYGGGFWPNDKLLQKYGWNRIAKYQYSTPNAKVKWEDGLKRFLVNRTEVMSDIFNAVKKRNVFRFPCWDEFQKPFGADFLNIFSEYSEQRRENVYKKAPSSTDDTFHSILLCFVVSMIDIPRPDIIAPMRDSKSAPPSVIDG
jgi:hypothetical protein